MYIEVIDSGPYITDGSKQPYYIGHFRLGFGNTWGVKTQGQVPLADQCTDDIIAELTATGFNMNQTSFDRSLQVVIREVPIIHQQLIEQIVHTPSILNALQ